MGLAKAQDDPILLEMELLAKKEDFSIVGRLVGLSLEVLAKSIGAKRIFEFGSGYGYSAYWFARAVGPKGKVICTDGEKENRDQAEKFLSRADFWRRIEFKVGMAQDIVKKFRGTFDICYNDVDKGVPLFLVQFTTVANFNDFNGFGTCYSKFIK